MSQTFNFERSPVEVNLKWSHGHTDYTLEGQSQFVEFHSDGFNGYDITLRFYGDESSPAYVVRGVTKTEPVNDSETHEDSIVAPSSDSTGKHYVQIREGLE